ncbi:CpXC domain-containing protein [uncultured Psychroserpens sp.]|uniref:CpXC domain-containing protein n=1 Tax=uncultured Psychroserpens sp. TaxID=255436 RepID=UPI002612D4F3|nr:CpXC domain-containing protein [uncultured Psychroserpens sp.]
MSLEQKRLSNCPNCGSEEQLTFYSSVNVTIQPELKTKVIKGQLNDNTCSNCKKNINVVSGFLYHDMQNQIMINFKTEDTNDDSEGISGSEILKDLKDKGYIYREVFSYPKLVEKIQIFDLKLNDQIIDKTAEGLKLMLSESLKATVEDPEDYKVNILFNSIKKGLFKKKIQYYFFTHPSQMMQIEYDFKNLTKEDRIKLFQFDSLRD